MKKILLTILAVLAMSGMAMAQTAPSDINLHRNDDGSWSFIMPGRNLVMSTESFSSNDPNGYTLAGVPEGWLVIAAGDTVTITDGVTTPITEGAPVTIVPTGNLRRIKSITLVDVLPPVAAPTLTLGEMTQGGDPLNNGSGSETYFSPTFSEGQQVAVFYKNTSGQTVKALSDALTASDISNEGKSTTINVTIDDADKTQPVTYIYPATMANEDGTVNYGSFNFTAQSGTEASLSTVRNCCKGSGAWDGNALPSVSMASQIAIWKLTMTDVNGMIMAQKVTVKVGGNKVAEASASGVYFAYPIVIYLALDPATMGTGTLRIEADEFGTIYYYQKDGGVSLTAGKFYQSAVELKR